MRNKHYILITIICLTIVFSIVSVFYGHKFEEAQSPGVTFTFSKEDYLFGLIQALLFIGLSFILGYISWKLLYKWNPNKIFIFIILNLVGTTYFGYKVLNQIYQTWHYNKFQANIDYNNSLTKRNGNFLDSCMFLVQQDIRQTGLSQNDYRISYFEYDNELSTIPRDTSNKFYSYNLFYYLTSNDNKQMRAASYLVNFNGKIKKLYDLDTKDKKAKKQIENLKQNLKKLKETLNEIQDSTTDDFETLKSKLKRLE